MFLKKSANKVAVSRAVKKLQEKQLVIRQISNSDKRRSILTLSDSGKQMYEEIVPLAKEYEKELIKGFEPVELEQLFNLLNKLKESNRHLISHRKTSSA